MVFPNEVVALPDPAVAIDLVDGPTFKDKLVAQLGPYKPVVEALQAHGLTLPTRTLAKTAAYTMVPGDGTVLADGSGGAFNVTLPPHLNGRLVRVEKVDPSANLVTVLPGSGTVAGGANDQLEAQWHGATYQSDGTNWAVVARAVPRGTYPQNPASPTPAVALLTTTDQTKAGSLTHTGPYRNTSGEPNYDIKGFGPSSTAAERIATTALAVAAWGATGGRLNVHGAWDTSGGPGLVLPIVPPTPHTLYEIKGDRNAVWSTTSAHGLITDPVPANTAAIAPRMNRKLKIQGIRFLGSTLAGQTGVSVIGSYGTVIEDCTFQNLEDGLDLIFCLMGSVRDCFGLQNVRHAFRARSGVGVWGDATDSNSGSNHTVFRDCRDYARAGALSQFYIFGSSGVVLQDCITEGGNPVNGVYFDANGSPTVKSFTVRNLHHENVSTQAAVRIASMLGGHVRLEDIWTGNAQVVVDASGCGTSAVLFATLPYFVPGSTPFKGDAAGCCWVFGYGMGNNNPRNSALWVGGIVPTSIAAHRFSDGTDALGNQYPTLDAGAAAMLKATYLFLRTGTGSVDGVLATGNVESLTIGNGFVVKSPNGTRYRITVADDGALITTAI